MFPSHNIVNVRIQLKEQIWPVNGVGMVNTQIAGRALVSDDHTYHDAYRKKT